MEIKSLHSVVESKSRLTSKQYSEMISIKNKIKIMSFLLSSSVGLAKAALEAINGFNLFGNQVKKIIN